MAQLAIAAPIPEQPGRLVGREQDLVSIGGALRRPDVRLLSLVGPGGTGKTRLAIAAAAEFGPSFADGACFVDLAPIHDPDLVVTTIALALGVRESGEQPLLGRLKDVLGERELLLVLDNFEQVVGVAPLLADLLGTCPLLKLIVTSRAALRVRWEHQLPVAPLAESPAVTLFVERAQAVRPEFTLTPVTAPSVVDICRRLDGLPLAIELAAARLSVLPPAAIAARLDHRLALLTGGPRDLSPRHQTLRAALDWSYDLLSEADQHAFRWLSVFVGGCSAATFEAVAGDANLDTLATLVDNSLLHSAGLTLDGEPSFGMLETIREYALDKLIASGESEKAERAHATFFLGLAEQAEPELSGPAQKSWLERLDSAHDNLRAALSWSQSPIGQPEVGLRLAAAMWRFWWYHGHLSEGRRWLHKALATCAANELVAVRATALIGAGVLARDQGDYDQAVLMLEESLKLSRSLHDQTGVAAALNGLGGVAFSRGDYAAASSFFEESCALRRALGDTHGLAVTLNNFGALALQLGDRPTAAVLCEEGLRLAKQLDDVEVIALALDNLGDIARAQHDFAGAGARYLESLAAYRAVGDRGQGIAESFEGLAAVAAAQAQPQRAARLLGAARSLRTAVGVPVPRSDSADHR